MYRRQPDMLKGKREEFLATLTVVTWNACKIAGSFARDVVASISRRFGRGPIFLQEVPAWTEELEIPGRIIFKGEGENNPAGLALPEEILQLHTLAYRGSIVLGLLSAVSASCLLILLTAANRSRITMQQGKMLREVFVFCRVPCASDGY